MFKTTSQIYLFSFKHLALFWRGGGASDDGGCGIMTDSSTQWLDKIVAAVAFINLQLISEACYFS